VKLYVWHQVLIDWSSGVCFAVAESPEEAVKRLREAGLSEWHIDGVKVDGVAPTVYDKSVGFFSYGGG